MPLTSRAFLAVSFDGHCSRGPPRPSQPFSQAACERRDLEMGLLPELSASDTKSWGTAASRCAAHCKACAQCKWISLSLRYGDCWWYSRCIQGDIKGGFRSAAYVRVAGAGMHGSDSFAIDKLRDEEEVPLDRLAVAIRSRSAERSGFSRLIESSTTPPRLLLGIFSGSEARRELLRCTWLSRVQTSGVRARFVVARSADGQLPSDADRDDVELATKVALPAHVEHCIAACACCTPWPAAHRGLLHAVACCTPWLSPCSDLGSDCDRR